MKRQVISHYNQSKQVLNDFFNNSDDDDEDGEEDKNIQFVHDQIMMDECEQYPKGDNISHTHHILAPSALNSNNNIIHQSMNNQTLGQVGSLHQFDLSLQHIQQIAKPQIGTNNNQDIFQASYNHSLGEQQYEAEHFHQPLPMQLSNAQHQQMLQNFSQDRRSNPVSQSDLKNVNRRRNEEESNQSSDSEREREDRQKNNMDDYEEDAEEDEDENNNKECEESTQKKYQKEQQDNQYYLGNSNKQQIISGNGPKYLMEAHESVVKGDIIKLPTSYNNNEESRGKFDGAKSSQSAAISNKKRKIRLMKIQTQNLNNRTQISSKDSPFKFSVHHKEMMKKEISLNFIVVMLFGLYLVLKKTFLDDPLGGNSQITVVSLASGLMFIGLLGIVIIYKGVKNSAQFQSSSNSMNSKVILSSGEKGALTDYSQTQQINNKSQHNQSNNFQHTNVNTQTSKKPQMKMSNNQTQISQSPQKVTQHLLKQGQQNNDNQELKQSMLDSQKKESTLKYLSKQKDRQLNSSSPQCSDSSPNQGSIASKDQNCMILSIICLFVASYVLLIESIRLVNNSRSLLLLFSIYHQFIIIYKLSASRISQTSTFLISFLLISYAITRSKLFLYFNDSNFNIPNTNTTSLQFIIEDTIMDCIFALSILFQTYPLRFLAISPFLFHLYGDSTLSQEKILINAGISPSYDFQEVAGENESTAKPYQFMNRLVNNRIKQKNLHLGKDNKTHLTSSINRNNRHNMQLGDDNLNLNDMIPLSPEIERQKSNHIKKMYQDILNLIPEGVALINGSNKLVYANKTLSKILQCSKSQIVKILLNLATKSNAEYDTTSYNRGVLNTNVINSPQISKSLNQALPLPRPTSQSIYRSYNSLINNNNNNGNSTNNINSTNQANNNNTQVLQNSNANSFTSFPLDLNNINPNKLNNPQTNNASNNNQNFPNPLRKVSAENFDSKRKISNTTKPSLFNRNHKTSFSKDESPAIYNMTSTANNGTINNIPYHQMLTQSNTRNLSTNGATPNNLNFNTYQGGSDTRKQSVPYINNYKSSPFEQTMPNMPINNPYPIDDLFDNKNVAPSQNTNLQHKIYQPTNEFSDAVSLTHYIQQCPLGTCTINCVHNQTLFRENGPDTSSFNDQFRQGMTNILNASSNPNQEQGGEHLVRKQRSKKFKKSEIIRKDISVQDILSSIFENLKQTQQDQDTKTAKTFQLKKKNSDITSQQTYTAPQPNRKPPLSRQGSFISQMKIQQQYIGYFQYVDDMIKVEVEYKNSTLVLSMVMCEIVTNGFVEQLALVLVDPLWQEMYEKKLEDMSKYRMKMFASLSHELRTPLNCSISMLQQVKSIMKEDSQFDEKQQEGALLSIKERIRNKLSYVDNSKLGQKEIAKAKDSNQMIAKLIDKMSDYIQTYIDPALNSNKLLLNLINDILDFVQIDSGKFKFSFIKFDLEELLSSCVSLVGIQGKENDIELVLKYDENCPKIVNSDPNRIRQVVLNFLSNAMKFTSHGQIIVTATLINHKDRQISQQNLDMTQSQFYDEELMNNSNHVVEIAVEDQGIGISPDDIEKIFTIFNKIDLGENQTLNSQGCGLGLTISNSIAKGLGPINKGGIRVQSEIGQGSVFSILVEDREEELQEHKINNKEAIKKMETINSQVDSPISQQTKIRQLSSFGQIEYGKQTSLFGRNHSMKIEDSPQVRTLRINSNFTNKSNRTNRTNKTNKTSKTNKTNKTVKTNNQKNVGGSGLGAQQLYEDSCCVCDSEINRNSIQHLTPRAAHQVKQHELAEFDDLSSSSNRSDFIHHDILNMSQKSSRSFFNNNQKPFYKSATIHTKTTYKTKTLKTIKSEQKDSGDAYISYNSIHSQAQIKKRNSSSPTTSLMKAPSLSQENVLQLHLSPMEASNSKQESNKIAANSKRKFLAQSGIRQSQSSSTSLQKKGFVIPSSSSALKNIATTATTVVMPPSQQETNLDNFERNSQEIFISNDLNYNIFKKKSEEDEQFDAQQQVFENSGEDHSKNLNSQNRLISKNNSNINNTSIEGKTQLLKSGKICDCPQILVVDDNAFNMHAITMQLKTYGFKIDTASNGKEAVNCVEKRYYDNSCCKSYKLIFMDIEMPIKNGYEATQEIRNFFNGNSYISKQPIIVACTAYVSDEDKQKALVNGMDDFIKKPVFQEGLDLLLNQWYNVIFDENNDFEEDSDEDRYHNNHHHRSNSDQDSS